MMPVVTFADVEDPEEETETPTVDPGEEPEVPETPPTGGDDPLIIIGGGTEPTEDPDEPETPTGGDTPIIVPGSSDVIGSGKDGGISWVLKYDGVLTISGSGDMKDYKYTNKGNYNTPWYSYRGSIVSVVIANSVTSIGDCAFAGCKKLKSVKMGSSIESIGQSAFSADSSLKTVEMPKSILYIGKGAFESCGSISSVDYSGSYSQWNNISIKEGNTALSDAAVYQITFNSDTSKPETKIVSGLICKSDVLPAYMFTAPAGKQFSLWNTCPGNIVAAGYSYTPGTQVSQVIRDNGNKTKVTLYAWYKTAGYSIVYNANGGSGAPEAGTKEYSAKSYVISTAKPVKDGYTFKSWNTQKNGKGKTYNSGSKYTGKENLTLYAQWTPNTYYLKFDGNGADSGKIKDATVIRGEESGKLPTRGFKKEGYTLVGWNIQSGGKNYENKAGTTLSASQVDFFTAGLRNKSTITLYAVWEPIAYSITYKKLPSYEKNSLDKANANNVISYRTGKAVVLNEPHVPGYSFGGWYSDSRLKNKVSGISAGQSGDKTFYAKTTPIEYSITYDLGGGTQNSKNPTQYTISRTAYLHDPSRIGYTFTGWHLKTGNSYASDTISSLKKETYYGGNITLCASWKPITYTVKYNLVGGTNIATGKTGNFSEDYRYDESFNLPEGTGFTKTGYSFKCWENAKGQVYSPAQLQSNLVANTGTVNLTICWEPTVYKVTYVLDGGKNNGKNPTTHTVESSSKLADPTKNGYTFEGWYTSKSFKNKVTAVPKTADDVTLYAKWTPNSVSIALYSPDGKKVLVKATSYKSGETLPDMTCDGKTVTRWNTEVDGSGTVYSANEPIEAISVKKGSTLKLYAVVTAGFHYELKYTFDMNNEEWASKVYASDGKNTHAKIGEVGCLVTCIAMVESYAKGRSINPIEVLTEQNMVFTTGVTVGLLSYAENYKPVGFSDVSDEEKMLKELYTRLKDGMPVILGAEGSVYGTHFVVVTGYTGDGVNFKAEDFTVVDPSGWSYNNTTVATYIGGFGIPHVGGFVETVAFPIITEMWCYSK